MKKIFTLCYPVRESEILLGLKKRNFGVGIWNGFGGKVKIDETIEEAAVRELKEESDLNVVNFEKVGILNFEFQTDEGILLEVHIFRVNNFEGQESETEEMIPQWFRINNLPFNKMWAGDEYWLPLLLSGKKFKGYFMFDRPSDEEYNAKILKYDLKEVDNL